MKCSGVLARFKNRESIVRFQAVLLVAAACLFAAIAHADQPSDTSSVDTSTWRCNFCTYDYGWMGQLDAGLGRVSNSSYRFGEYTGLKESGMYWLLGGNVKYRSKDGGFLDVSADHLGIAARELNADGGRQGAYEWFAGFQEIPQFLYESGRTPFSGLGTDSLALPTNWVAAGSTGGMSKLSQDSKAVDIGNTRRIASAGIRFTPPQSHWRYSVNFQRDTRTGNDLMGASFLNTTTQLPVAMDYRTNQVRATANYAVSTWQFGIGYYGSFFSDANNALTWDNPFLPIMPGATRGQLSLPPGNAYNAISLSGAWQALESTRFMATASIGRGTQDERFIAPTLNSQLAVAALPSTNLDGKVNTLNYALRAYSSPSQNLDLTFDYTLNRHDDHTAQNAYQQAITDTYLADYATNIPYSYSRTRGDLIADYRVSSRVNLEGGAAHTGEDRTFRDAAETRTDSLWASLRADPTGSVNTFLKFAHERRSSPDYTPVDYLFNAQNPLLRQFDLANRSRNQVSGQLGYTPSEHWSTAISGELNNDNYDGTDIGLTQSKDIEYTFTVTYTPADKLDLNGYFTHQVMAWRQAGSASFSYPDWYGERGDRIQTVGLSAERRDIAAGLDGGLDFSYSLARGATVVMTSATSPLFPDITMRLQHLSLYAKYSINAKFALRLDYQIERYATTDWSFDGVNPNTVSNLLALGIYSPNYVVNVVSVTAEYSF